MEYTRTLGETSATLIERRFLFSSIPIPEFSHSAGGVVLNARGEVLIVRQRDNSWSLPKGKINPNETPREAAIREIAEESGVTDLDFVKILGSYSRYTISNTGSENTQRLKRITMYLFTTNELELHPMDPRIPEARWLEKDDVIALLTHPKDQEFLKNALPEMNLLLVG